MKNVLKRRASLVLLPVVAAILAGCVVAPGPGRSGAYPPGYPVGVHGGRDRDRYEHDRDDERKGRERRRDRDRDDDDRDDRRRGGYATGPQIDIRIGGYFNDRHRNEANGYYREQYRSGHCPPGLAKKNNGCMPPGQARRWGLGQPLPPDVAYVPLEPAVQVRLGVPPSGYRFVRVAGDILMIAVGTAIVVDAIQDLGGR